jgi:hypothetical protein
VEHGLRLLKGKDLARTTSEGEHNRSQSGHLFDIVQMKDEHPIMPTITKELSIHCLIASSTEQSPVIYFTLGVNDPKSGRQQYGNGDEQTGQEQLRERVPF